MFLSFFFFSFFFLASIFFKISKFQENGYYVESGALDGEQLSNSLFFEKHRKWTGVLIEPHPHSYKILKSRNRKAFSINVCLSPTPHPVQVQHVTSIFSIFSIDGLSSLFFEIFTCCRQNLMPHMVCNVNALISHG